MNKRNQLLITLGLSSCLLQAPAANAQAQLVVAVGAKLIPVLIPLAIGALPAVPTLINQLCHPLPKNPKTGKKPLDYEADITAPHKHTDGADSDSESVNGSAHASENDQEEEEVASAPHRAKAADNSDWFMEDDDQAGKAVPTATRVATTPSASKNLRIAEEVEGKVLPAPSELKATATTMPAPAQARGSSHTIEANEAPETASLPEKEEDTHPVIMMKLSE